MERERLEVKIAELESLSNIMTDDDLKFMEKVEDPNFLVIKENIQYVYKKYEMDLSRTTYTQIKQGKSIALSDIKENDLVFFDTRASSMLTKAKSQGVSGTLDTIIINESDTGNSKKLYPSEPTHVGMYIGNGKMIHASSSKKQVVVEVLGNDYFKDRIVDIRRYK